MGAEPRARRAARRRPEANPGALQEAKNRGAPPRKQAQRHNHQERPPWHAEPRQRMTVIGSSDLYDEGPIWRAPKPGITRLQAQNGSRMRWVANGLVTGFRGNKRRRAREAWNATVRASQRMRLRGAAGASDSGIAEHISAAECYGGKQTENGGIPGYSVNISHLAVRIRGLTVRPLAATLSS